jgi:serine/threonine-protein kinase RsbW
MMQPEKSQTSQESSDRENYDVELNIPPELVLVKLVVDLGISLMEIRGYEEHDRDAIQLAIHEMLVNAIRYGSHDNPDSRVIVRFAFRGDCFYTDIEDEGSGFELEHLSDPTTPDNILKEAGRGIFLAQQLTHKFHVEKLPKKGFRVSFCRYKNHH